MESTERPEGGDIVETGSAAVFAWEWFAVTVRRGRHGQLHPVQRQREARRAPLARGPVAVLHAPLRQLADQQKDRELGTYFRRQRWL